VEALEAVAVAKEVVTEVVLQIQEKEVTVLGKQTVD
jgi:hypothetical protein